MDSVYVVTRTVCLEYEGYCNPHESVVGIAASFEGAKRLIEKSLGEMECVTEKTLSKLGETLLSKLEETWWVGPIYVGGVWETFYDISKWTVQS